ncbi:MAG: hypothetical protein OK422_03320 [Thaumarchaeota archaeon]|nr:hypothetical protein [Nitrososphaerota archaeon]
MKVSLVWHSPSPERVIAVAMRRCYSTKPIEEIQAELDQKGEEYWRYLLMRALQDKSLDVIEHYCLELLLEGMEKNDVSHVAMAFPFAKFMMLNEKDWLLSMNARTLIEMWRDVRFKPFAASIVEELKGRGVGLLFNSVAFGA